jgi:hypothetical protein
VAAPAGAGYLYTKDSSGWPTTPTSVFADHPSNEFGWSVGVSGSAAIVGAPDENEDGNGTAYVYHS